MLCPQAVRLHPGYDPPSKPQGYALQSDFGLEDGGSPWESFVRVSTIKPHKLLDVSQDWLDLFQFSREEVTGRALRLVSGPTTNMHQLSELIDRAQNGKEGVGTAVLYSSSGVGKLVSVRTFPSPHSSDSCVIEMRPSSAISVNDSNLVEQNTQFAGQDASVIVCANESFAIERLNESFMMLFGCTPETTLGRNLRLIYGPRTNGKDFDALLKSARCGFSRCTTLNLYTSRCEELVCSVRAVPLVDGNGELWKLMVQFNVLDDNQHHHHEDVKISPRHDMIAPPPPPPSMRAPHVGHFGPDTPPSHVPPHPIPEEGELDSLTSTMASALAIDRRHIHANPKPCPPGPSPAVAWDFSGQAQPLAPARPGPGEGAGSPACPETRLSRASSEEGAGGQVGSLKLIPRKKGVGGSPVEVSVQVLRDMGAMSMRRAAEELGIAPSTLKKACRKLGMKKWLHTPSPPPIQQHAMDYNSAYVRSLHTKYAPKRPASSAASSDSEGAGWAEDWARPAAPDSFGFYDATAHGPPAPPLGSSSSSYHWQGHGAPGDPAAGWQQGVGGGWDAGGAGLWNPIGAGPHASGPGRLGGGGERPLR